MSYHRQTAALIEQGWIRAVILLILYVGLSGLLGQYLWSPELWFTVSSLLSFFLVFLCRKML